MKNRTFVIIVCIAFLAAMIGMAYAKGDKGSLLSSTGNDSSVIMAAEPDELCEPMTQGFWKRLCKKNNPVGIFLGFDDPLELCADLQVQGNDKKDPCVRAYSQYAALSYNLYYGILSGECTVYEDDGTPTTVSAMLLDIENLLGAGDPESCKEASYLAEGINSRDFFEDPYYQANLFNVEQNTFYKDIYAKISNWLNDFLNI